MTLRYFTISLILILAGALVMHLLVTNLPLNKGEKPRVQYWQPFDIPDSDQYFFNLPTGDELSQSMFYHDLGGLVERARQADVIFIGNSRLNLGLRGDYLLPLAEKDGVKIFSMGFGHAEMHTFPMELIRKHDLRPKILVFVGGPRYYGPRISPPARSAMSMSRWQAIKKRFEATNSFYLTYWLHQFIPRLDVFDKRLYSRWINYRSYTSGFTTTVREPSGRFPVVILGADKQSRNFEPYIRVRAEQLNKELEDRGTLMFATLVPFGRTEFWHLELFEQEFGIPYVLASHEGMTTADGSHLNDPSASIYSQRFWNAFIQHPEVVNRLELTHE